MDPRISVSALCYYTTPLPEFVDRLQRLGVHTTTLLAGAVTEFGPERARDLVNAADIAVEALVAGLPADLADEQSWDTARATLIDALDAAAVMGVRAVYTVTGAALDDTNSSVDAFARYIAPVVAHASETGVQMLIEPSLPDYAYVSFTHTIKTALRISERTGVGLCLDVYHVWDDPDLDRLLRDHIDLVGIVQIGDSSRDANGTLQKQIPGEGDAGIADLVARIVDAGYRGAFDLEIDGPFIEAVGVDESVARAVDYMRRALEAAPVPGV